MKRNAPKVLIAIGILFLLSAGGLFVYSRVDNYLAGQRAELLLQQILVDGWEITELAQPAANFLIPIRSEEALENIDEQDEPGGPGAPGEPLVFSVIGILEIPVLNRRLPVLDRSTPALLNISICRFTGSTEGKPERLVIAGHNYAAHFGRINTMSYGDEIIYTTSDGETFRYSMIGMESCHMHDTETLRAGDDWDITLLTCQTADRSMRTLVRFREITE